MEDVDNNNKNDGAIVSNNHKDDIQKHQNDDDVQSMDLDYDGEKSKLKVVSENDQDDKDSSSDNTNNSETSSDDGKVGTDNDDMVVDSKNAGDIAEYGDVMDLPKLFDLLEISKSAGDKIAGKDVLLLIGGTGAGKTTTTLYFAGATFEEVEVDGRDHYNPIELPNPDLSEFTVMGGSQSVTKTIHATTVMLPDSQESITICDTPGFGDSAGAEMDISNGLGIIHALRRAKSVKPVLVLNRETMAADRYQNLKNTLETVTKMLGEMTDFAPFGYIFTRCDGNKKKKRIHKELAAFLRDNSVDEVLDALINDMVKKTNPTAIGIEPEEKEEAPTILKELWFGTERLHDPRECFVDFISESSSLELKLQVNRMLSRMDSALKEANPSLASDTLGQLSRLSDMVPLAETHDGCKQGKAKMIEYSSQLLDRIENACKSMDIALAEKYLRELQGMVDLVSSKESEDAFENGKVKYSDLVVRIKSDVESLVVESLEDATTKCAKKYERFLALHKEKLSDLSKAQHICKSYNLTSPVDFNDVLNVSLETLLKANRDMLAGRDESSTSLNIFQVAFHNHIHLSEALHDMVADSDRLKKETDILIDNVSSFIKQELVEVESILEESFTAEASEKIKAGVEFLLEIKTYVDTLEFPSFLGVNPDSWLWLKSKMEAFLKAVAEKNQSAMDRLQIAATSLDNLLDNEDKWPSSFRIPSLAKELLEDRAVVLLLVSSDTLRSGTEMDEPSVLNARAVVSFFDRSLVSLLGKAVKFLKERAEALRDNGLDAEEKIEATSKEAEMLLETVQPTSDACSNFQELDSSFLESVTGLAATKAVLEGVIKDSKNSKKRSLVASSSRARKKLKAVVDLTKDEIAKLRSDSFGKQWHDKYEELRQYRKKNGHCCVPCKDSKLGRWVNTQRTLFVKGKLNELREAALNKLGFSFDGKEEYMQKKAEEWNENFEKLKRHRERLGHFPAQKSGKLGVWLSQQRQWLRKWIRTGEYEHGQKELAEERYNKMDSIAALN